MLDPQIPVSWSAGLAWLTVIAVASFLVSWTFSDLRPTRRSIYVPVLALVTGALTIGYVLWSDVGAAFLTNNWGLGLIGAAVAGGFLTALLNRRRMLDATPRAVDVKALFWDGLVYGAAEGTLLSVLPVVVTWQMLTSNGWNDAAAGLMSIAVSIAVIIVHHLGYPDFRVSRAKVGQAVLGCGVLSIAYLFTASIVAPIVAHAVLHVAIVRNGMELPPHEEDHTVASATQLAA